MAFTISFSPKAAGLPPPTSLGGVTVSLGGRAAPLLFVGESQVNFQVPYETPLGTSTMVVTANGVAGRPAFVSVAAAAPGIFVYGNNWAVVLNQDYSLNGPSNPAKAGSYVMLYGTGAGAATPAVPTGSAAPASPLSTVTNVTATINGVLAKVTFQGLAPGFVGLLQVNMQVPALPKGTYPVQIAAGGVKSNSASIAVTP
jgi:adhesin/invasin